MFASEYVSYSGDKAFAKEILPVVKRVYEKYFQNYDGSPIKRVKGEQYWHYYDSSDTCDEFSTMEFEAETDALCNIIAAYSVKKAISLANAADDKEYAKELKDIWCRLRDTVNTHFYNEQTGLYNSFIEKEHIAQLTQVYALLAGIAPDKKKCEQALVNPPKGMIKLSLSTLPFKYEVLLGNKKYHRYILDEVRRIWGAMLYHGATTFYEVEKDGLNIGSSYCHAWSSAPIYVYEKIFGNYYN